MTEWEDATSYKQGERAKGAEPRSWRITSGTVSIWVGRGHIRNPGYWTMHCNALGMETVDTKLPDTVDAATAQQVAIELALNKVKRLTSDILKLHAP